MGQEGGERAAPDRQAQDADEEPGQERVDHDARRGDEAHELRVAEALQGHHEEPLEQEKYRGCQYHRDIDLRIRSQFLRHGEQGQELRRERDEEEGRGAQDRAGQDTARKGPREEPVVVAPDAAPEIDPDPETDAVDQGGLETAHRGTGADHGHSPGIQDMADHGDADRRIDVFKDRRQGHREEKAQHQTGGIFFRKIHYSVRILSSTRDSQAVSFG